MLTKFSQLLLLSGLTVCARADVLYQFSYTSMGGQFLSTSFQLDEPTFLGVGPYSITPFTMSDGSFTYNFTQLYVGETTGPLTCFAFGPAAAVLGNCGNSSIDSSAAPIALINGLFSGAVPSTPGIYSQIFTLINGFELTTGNQVQGDGSMTLTIAQTPEPATGTAVGIVLLAGFASSILRRARPN